MVRILLFVILFIVVARAFWRVVDNIIEAASGQPPRAGVNAPRGVQMVRDPVCGTFVVKERALSLGEGARAQFFCSEACRDKYRAQRVEGRTA